MTFERAPIVIQLEPHENEGENELTVHSASFEEAFGEHSELFGKGRARRRARRAKRRAKRAHRKLKRRQSVEQSKAEEEAALNDAANTNADDGTSAVKQPTDAQQDNGAGADQTATQDTGAADASTANQAQDGTMQGQTSAPAPSYASDDNSGGGQDMNPNYANDGGGDSGPDDEDGASFSGIEHANMVNSGEESSMFAIETDSSGAEGRRSKSWEMDYLEEEYEKTMDRYDHIRATLAKAGLPPQRKSQLIQRAKAEMDKIQNLKNQISKLRAHTGIAPNVKAKVAPNRIEIPASSAEGHINDERKMDYSQLHAFNRNSYDAPPIKVIDIDEKSSGFDAKTAIHSINWKWVGIGAAIAVVAIVGIKMLKPKTA